MRRSQSVPDARTFETLLMLNCILKIFRRGYLPFVLAFPGRLIVLDASAAPPDGYYLVWADEFSGSSLDLAKWGAWVGPNRDAVNVADAVTVGGGHLTITTYTANGTHYSGIISSEGRFRADYGYYEASLEFNGSPGMFSGFWLNSPTTGRYIGDPSASGVEIDICEHRKTDTGNADDINNVVQTTVHWDGYSTDEKTVTSGNIGSGLGTGFHTYGFLWQHTNYSFTIDGTPQWSTAAALSDRTEVITLSSEVWSNSFAGIVPPGGYGDLLNSTTTMVVDYVRYYAPTTTVFWTGASSADWNATGNWLANQTPNASNDVVFSYLSVGNFSISLGQNTTVRGLSIQEAGPISITGNTLTIGSGAWQEPDQCNQLHGGEAQTDMGQTLTTAWECCRCGHIWLAKVMPRRCAKCLSRRWRPAERIIQGGPSKYWDDLALGQTHIKAWKCDVCGHIWRWPTEPARCAKCRSRNWNDGVTKPQTILKFHAGKKVL